MIPGSSGSGFRRAAEVPVFGPWRPPFGGSQRADCFVVAYAANEDLEASARL